MKNGWIICVGLITGVLAFSAKAEEEKHAFAPEQRFLVFSAEAAMRGSEKADVREITLDKAPAYIQNQLLRIAESCTGSADHAAAAKIYSYSTEKNLLAGLPSNYIVDFVAFKELPLSPCMIGNICNLSHECQVIGYTALAMDDWERTFTLMAEAWVPFSEAGAGQTLIRVQSLNSSCGNGVRLDEEMCVTDYVWRRNGLTALKQHSFASAEPSVEPTLEGDPE